MFESVFPWGGKDGFCGIVLSAGIPFHDLRRGQADYRVFIQIHSPVFGIFLPELGDGPLPFRGVGGVVGGQQFRRAGNQDVPELAPVGGIVMVDQQGGLRIFQNVADAAQAGQGGALGLCIQNGIDTATLGIGAAIQGKADRDDVGRGVAAGRGQAGYRGRFQPPALLGG